MLILVKIVDRVLSLAKVMAMLLMVAIVVLPLTVSSSDTVEDLTRLKREPQQRSWNQVVSGNSGSASNNANNGGGLQRSFSTGDLDQLGRRRRPGQNNNNNNGQSCKINYDFDYFVLSIQWPKSFCLEKQECDMKIAKEKKWLIHGLWPNRNRQQALGRNRRDVKLIDSKNSNSNNDNNVRGFGGSDPNLLGQHNQAEFCCGPRYNSSLIKGQLYQELLDKWPTLHPGGRHHSFWQHEWQKHGTCARQVRPLQTQLKYFETILGLYNQFNLNSVPFQNGKSYKIIEVHQMIEPRVGNFKVRLECSLIDGKFNGTTTNTASVDTLARPNNNNQGQQRPPRVSIFSEVHICLNKQLRPIDCPHRDDYQCKRSILFP